MYESQDTGIAVSRGNSRDGQSSRGRCSGLARCAERTAKEKTDQAGRAGKPRTASVIARTFDSKTAIESVESIGWVLANFSFPLRLRLSSGDRIAAPLEVAVIQQVVVGNHAVATFRQNLQGHVEIVHRQRDRTVTVAPIDQRVRVMNVDFRLQER